MSVHFVDTNVLLYAISTDPAEQDKADRARALLTRRDLCLSTQVLQEFYVQATRPTRSDRLSGRHAEQLVRSFSRYRVQPVTLSVVVAAITTSQRYRISYWDAAIVEASRTAKSDVVLSEDLQHGMDFHGVGVSNPFLSPSG